MLQNYFKIAIRNLLRNRIYTFINTLGLSLGMACAIVLYLYIQHELSYDSYHQKYKEIYRATTDMKMADNHIKFGITSGLLAGTLQKEYPEVRKVCRIHGTYRYLVENGKSKLYENDVYYVDSTFFDFFDYEFLQGNPQKALLQPNSVVITKRFAEKVFGSAVNAIGKTLKFNEKENDIITGVIDNPPLNSNIDFNVLISLSTIAKEAEEHNLNSWGSYGDLFTFVLLPKDYNAQID
jgi:putative ABC transport system permease protein